MQRALVFVLGDDRVDDKGYYGRADGSRMYGHGIITLMLTEMLGMGVSDEQDQQIHDRCQKAIDVILSAQKVQKPTHYRGGWRYTPESTDSDLSVSIWQLMALRSAAVLPSAGVTSLSLPSLPASGPCCGGGLCGGVPGKPPGESEIGVAAPRWVLGAMAATWAAYMR